MQKVRIEKCLKKHYDDMFNLHKDVMPLNDQMTKHNFYDEFNQKTRQYFVALSGDEVVGYIGVFDMIEDYNIIGIAVKKEYQRKKIGSLLLERIVSIARENNVNSLSLEVDSINEKAINFYKNKGFEVTNIRKNYYKNNDALIMWLYL